MELSNTYGRAQFGTKGAAELYQKNARQNAKRAELERYFPGLYTKNSADPSPALYGQKSKFALELEKNLEQKRLSRTEIQEEVKREPEKKKLYQAALDFQALFIDRMLSAIRKNLNPENDPLYGGFRQKVFDDMLYEEYSRMLSRSDNFGIADDIYRQGRARL